MPSLSKLEGLPKPIIMKVRGLNIHAKVIEDRILGKNLTALQANILMLNDTPDPALVLNITELSAEFLASALHWWDLTEDPPEDAPAGTEGPPVPLTAERLQEFGLTLLLEMVAAMVAEVKMGEAKGTFSRQALSATPTKAPRSSSRR